jgi:hypothetical protein
MASKVFDTWARRVLGLGDLIWRFWDLAQKLIIK